MYHVNYVAVKLEEKNACHSQNEIQEKNFFSLFLLPIISLGNKDQLTDIKDWVDNVILSVQNNKYQVCVCLSVFVLQAIETPFEGSYSMLINVVKVDSQKKFLQGSVNNILHRNPVYKTYKNGTTVVTGWVQIPLIQHPFQPHVAARDPGNIV